MNANASIRFSLITLAVTVALACGSMAQATPQTDVPGHPRVNEVNHRLENQQDRIQKGVANGTITQRQAVHDETRVANMAQRESADEARHNGHLTKAEDHHLNHAENRNSHHIRHQRKH